MSTSGFDDFEMVISGHGGRSLGGRSGFNQIKTPSIRFGLHVGGKEENGEKRRKQFSVGLNESAMIAARFVAGDKVNIGFSKDRSMMMIERHPKGQFTLSPIAASKTIRDDAFGKSKLSAIKFASPSWAIGNARLIEGFVVGDSAITIDGSRLVVQVNL